MSTAIEVFRSPLLRFTLLLVLALPVARSQTKPAASGEAVRVLIRCDDAGLCHAVNMAIAEVADAGIPFSASVMVPCPWFTEAVEILKAHPDVSVGIHLTLNAEWKEMRWGPVLGAAAVPSLVDTLGNFFPSRTALMAHQPKLDEVERELRAQIQRALAAGLRPDYLDYHMGAAVGTPELRAIVEKLASEFQVGISRYFGEVDAPGLYESPVAAKTDSLVQIVGRLRTDVRQLLVFHLGNETPEMDALTDLNPFGPPDMSKHRNGERRALLSPEFAAALRARSAVLMTYRDVIRLDNLGSMRRPAP